MVIRTFRLRLAILLGASLVPAGFIFAHTTNVIPTPDQNDTLPLTEPAVSQTIYGTLEGYPHMYEFYTKDPIRLHIEIDVPEIKNQRTNVSGIILSVQKSGRVKEIARLRAVDAKWTHYYDWWGGDSYLRGTSYEGDIEPGTYRIEISTPENIGKYALSVGTEEHWRGYFTALAQMLKVKGFFGASPLSILRSPLIFVPLILILVAASAWYWFRIRKRDV